MDNINKRRVVFVPIDPAAGTAVHSKVHIKNPLAVTMQQMTSELTAQMKEGAPELLKVACPRRIVPPHGYANPSQLGLMNAVTILSAASGKMSKVLGDKEGKISGTDITSAAMAFMMARYRFPAYFVEEEFLEAVVNTSPPEEMKLSEVKWPMEVMIFYLPLRWGLRHFGYAIPQIAVARMPAGSIIGPELAGRLARARCPVSPDLIENTADKLATLFVLNPSGSGMPVDYTGAWGLEKGQVKDLADASFLEEAPSIELGREFNNPDEYPQGEAEQKINQQMNSLALKLLLVLQAAPQYIEHGLMARPARMKHGVLAKEELWNPNRIGRGYRIKRPEGYVPSGTHASPRPHWRRGHCRTQRHGHGNALVKVIWIEPTLVNIAKGTE